MYILFIHEEIETGRLVSMQLYELTRAVENVETKGSVGVDDFYKTHRIELEKIQVLINTRQ